MDLWRAPLNSPTILSNCPPHQGARLKMNCHWIPWWARKFWNFSSRITCLIHLAAPTKVFPLSEYTFWGLPLREMKRLKLARNSVFSRLGNKSKNKARVRLQAYSFSLCFLSFLMLQRARVINANDLERSLPFCRILWQVSLGRRRENVRLKSSTLVAVLHDSFRRPS